jgi:hypothetical protein
VVEDLRGVEVVGGEPVLEVAGELVDVEAAAVADLVEEQVRGDAVEPAFEGVGPVGVQVAEDPDENVVGQVLRVVPVAGEAVGEVVDPRRVGPDDLLPGLQVVHDTPLALRGGWIPAAGCSGLTFHGPRSGRRSPPGFPLVGCPQYLPGSTSLPA